MSQTFSESLSRDKNNDFALQKITNSGPATKHSEIFDKIQLEWWSFCVRIMQICVLFVLLPVVSGLLFDLFSFKNKCQSPFHKSADDPLGKILQGFFKCPYEPTENPNLPIDNFVRFFFIQSGQTDFRVASVDDVANSINPNFTNFILIHGYTDGVQAGGTFLDKNMILFQFILTPFNLLFD